MGVILENGLNEGVGIWGAPTSTLDWCEENYIVCKYMAEFWNTISNIFTIVLPMMGYAMDWSSPLEVHFRLQYVALIVVGIGSWCFHGTLLYQLQLLDELPMIYGSAIMLYALFQVPSQPKKHNILSSLFLTTYSAWTTYIYLTGKNPNFFFVCYGFLVFLIIVQTALINSRMHHLNADDSLFRAAIFLFLSGFALWLIDFHFCPVLRAIRARLPYPISEIFQLHAWWHLGSGIGTYLYILHTNRLRLLYLGYDSHLTYKFALPYIQHSRSKQDHKHQ
ncbi:uncharacterized protein TRIADDRAFT_33194 [Trichoplax adhaerens]|uniref:Alkaline ceramidase n=1 Tax=Trichoplax adhaerens TaxID=10228 RepID=B3SCA9_TRIAD|nr:hypothetical protein TRIADDRAFT_33194 [Trichoplax adhaerens]EDV19630.1 hypothetical protein TRIADDRAFT_33194 [Trichoplax adhaerens]|eukprot:XP_002117868.1 hypothetical protein TRIADDRAFT_33194 [Trichoplax adhaerens]